MKAKRSFKTVRLNVNGTRYLKSMDQQDRIFQPLISAVQYPITSMSNGKTVSRVWSFGKPLCDTNA